MAAFDVVIEGRTIVLELEVDARTRSIELSPDEADELARQLTEAVIECDLDWDAGGDADWDDDDDFDDEDEAA